MDDTYFSKRLTGYGFRMILLDFLPPQKREAIINKNLKSQAATIENSLRYIYEDIKNIVPDSAIDKLHLRQVWPILSDTVQAYTDFMNKRVYRYFPPHLKDTLLFLINKYAEPAFFTGAFHVIKQAKNYFVINRYMQYIYYLSDNKITVIGHIKPDIFTLFDDCSVYIEDRDNNQLIFLAPVEWLRTDVPLPKVKIITQQAELDSMFGNIKPLFSEVKQVQHQIKPRPLPQPQRQPQTQIQLPQRQPQIQTQTQIQPQPLPQIQTQTTNPIYTAYQLRTWWNSLSNQWKEVMHNNLPMSTEPTDAELIQLSLITHIKINKQWEKTDMGNLMPLLIFKNLESLECREVGYFSMSGIEHLRKLKKLVVSFSFVTSISGIEHCTDLEYLDLYSIDVSDIRPISKLYNLKHVEISTGKIRNIRPLRKLHKLEYLSCANNRIRSLRPLRNLYELQYLAISGNPYRRLTPLRKLTKITELVICVTRIKSLHGLENMTSLKKIDAGYSYIKKLEPLCGLKNLKEINILNTRISKQEQAAFQQCNPTCRLVEY